MRAARQNHRLDEALLSKTDIGILLGIELGRLIGIKLRLATLMAGLQNIPSTDSL